MIGFPLGILTSNAAEWVIHKYILHGLGRRRKSFWSFHWHEHHKNARHHQNYDPSYERSVFGWHSQGKEALGLLGLAALHLPLFRVAPFFTLGVWYSIANYYRVHKRCHRDPAWAREHLPWHVDHHMGPDQDANWCVTRPWFDILMGTRVPYVGTQKEREDIERRARRAKSTAEKESSPAEATEPAWGPKAVEA